MSKLKQYTVEITQIVTKPVEVHARTAKSARLKAMKQITAGIETKETLGHFNPIALKVLGGEWEK